MKTKKVAPTEKNNSWQTVVYVLLLATLCVLIVRNFNFINRFSVDIPFADQWNYFPVSWSGGNLIDHFVYQLGPHRLGLAFIIDSYVLRFFDWNVRSVAFLSGFYLVLASVVILAIKKLLFKKFEFTDIVILFALMSLAQYKAISVDPFASYGTFTLLLIYSYVLIAVKIRFPIGLYALLFVNFLLLYSGFGYLMCLPTFILILKECLFSENKGLALIHLPIGLAIYLLSIASFLVGMKSHPGVDCFVFPDVYPERYVSYISLLYANLVGFGSYQPTALNFYIGFLAFLGIATLGITTAFKFIKTGGRVYMASAIFVGIPLVFSVLLTIGRACLGEIQALRSDYLIYMIPAFVGIYFLLLRLKQTKVKIVLLLILLFTIVRAERIVLTNDQEHIEWLALGKQLWVSCYLKSEDFDYCNKATGFAVRWSGQADREETTYWLHYLKENSFSFFRHE